MSSNQKGTSSSGGFTHTGSGTNSQGNHYCNRDYGTGSDSNGPGRGDAFHYSNRDGSYYYSNSDGSKYYYNDGKSSAWYQPSQTSGKYRNAGDGWQKDGAY